MSSVLPAGQYSVARQAGGLVYTAGMTPRQDSGMTAVGIVGETLSPTEATTAAGVAVQRALNAARECLAPGDSLDGVLSMTVFIAAAATFTALGPIADGASAVLQSEFPQAPLPVRAAIGVSCLPGGASVEIQIVATVAAE